MSDRARLAFAAGEANLTPVIDSEDYGVTRLRDDRGNLRGLFVIRDGQCTYGETTTSTDPWTAEHRVVAFWPQASHEASVRRLCDAIRNLG